MTKCKSLFLAFCLLAICVATGCGKAKVTGRVYFSDGTTPLTVGVVNFTDDKIICKGEINSETGIFEMRTFKPGDGVPPGTYKVYITEATNFGMGKDVKSVGDASYQVVGAATSLISPKYNIPEQSGLTITVNKSMKYDITLDDPPPKSAEE